MGAISARSSSVTTRDDSSRDEPPTHLSPVDGSDAPTRRAGARRKSARHTRFSAAWAAVSIAVIFGMALIVFIAQNTGRVHIAFFAVSAHVPVSVALLAASLAGAIVVLAIGVGRVTQLRWNLHRERRRVDGDANKVEIVVDNDLATDEDEGTARPQ